MTSRIEKVFPLLREDGYEITSPATREYNCIAWAVRDVDNFWWPRPEVGYFWPDEVPRIETVDAFRCAFALREFEECADGSMEDGYEKIALYVDQTGAPTHAARQLVDGRWTSKLGKEEDIEHTSLEGLSGKEYGAPTYYFRRPVRRG